MSVNIQENQPLNDLDRLILESKPTKQASQALADLMSSLNVEDRVLQSQVEDLKPSSTETKKAKPNLIGQCSLNVDFNETINTLNELVESKKMRPAQSEMNLVAQESLQLHEIVKDESLRKLVLEKGLAESKADGGLVSISSAVCEQQTTTEREEQFVGDSKPDLKNATKDLICQEAINVGHNLSLQKGQTLTPKLEQAKNAARKLESGCKSINVDLKQVIEKEELFERQTANVSRGTLDIKPEEALCVQSTSHHYKEQKLEQLETDLSKASASLVASAPVCVSQTAHLEKEQAQLEQPKLDLSNASKSIENLTAISVEQVNAQLGTGKLKSKKEKPCSAILKSTKKKLALTNTNLHLEHTQPLRKETVVQEKGDLKQISQTSICSSKNQILENESVCKITSPEKFRANRELSESRQQSVQISGVDRLDTSGSLQIEKQDRKTAALNLSPESGVEVCEKISLESEQRFELDKLIAKKASDSKIIDLKSGFQVQDVRTLENLEKIETDTFSNVKANVDLINKHALVGKDVLPLQSSEEFKTTTQESKAKPGYVNQQSLQVQESRESEREELFETKKPKKQRLFPTQSAQQVGLVGSTSMANEYQGVQKTGKQYLQSTFEFRPTITKMKTKIKFLFYLEVNPEQIEIDIGVKEAVLIDRKDGLECVTLIQEEAVVNRQAAISLRSHLAHSTEQINSSEKERSLVPKLEQQKKLNVVVLENKSLDVQLQDELNSEAAFTPLAIEQKAVCVDLVSQKALSIEQSEMNLKEGSFSPQEIRTQTCETQLIASQSTVVSETVSAGKETQLLIRKPTESNANLEQSSEQSLQISQRLQLETVEKFDKPADLTTNASTDLITTNALSIQQNLINENEKPKSIEKPKKKKLRVSILTREAVVVKELDSCQVEDKLKTMKSPKPENIDQSVTLKQAKQVSSVNLLDSVETVKPESLSSKSVEIDLLPNRTVSISKTSVLLKEDLKVDSKLISNQIKPKLIESNALQISQTNEQQNENELFISSKVPTEASLNLIDQKVISKSIEQLCERESKLKSDKPDLAEGSQSTVPNLAFNVSLDQHKEKVGEFETQPLKIKKAREKLVDVKQNSLEVQENQLGELVKPFESKPASEQHVELKLEQSESVSVSLQQPSDKEQQVDSKRPKLEAAKKRKEFRKSRSFGVQKTDSLEKEDHLTIRKPKLADTKESVETFSSSTQEQYFSLDSVDDFMPEQVSLKTGSVTIEKFVSNEIDQIQPGEHLDRLDEFIKPKEHTARESLVDDNLKTASLIKIDSRQSSEETDQRVDEQLKINLRKQKQDVYEEEETISEKTKISVQTRRKVIDQLDRESSVEETIHPRKITVESIQNEVDVNLRPKPDVQLDSKSFDETSEITVDKDEKFTFKPSKKEYTHTFEKDGDKISTVESETITDAKSSITIETRKKRPDYEQDAEIERPGDEQPVLSSEQEIEEGGLRIELVQDAEAKIDLKNKKKPKFVERFDLKPGKTEPVYNIAKEETAPELCIEKTDELDQPRKLEKHASTSIENLKTIGIDETKTVEREIELKPKQKKRVKIIIPTKEAQQLSEADQSIVAAEIKPDKYYGGMYS